VLLPLFTEVCEKVLKKSETQKRLWIFSKKYLQSTDEKDKIDLMFRFIQYIERQIVLFDAEDAAFPL
jgi:phosphoenolpyruvate carboxylase